MICSKTVLVWSMLGRYFLIVGRIRDSSTFAAGQRNELSLYEVVMISVLGWSMKTSMSSDRS